MQYRRKIGSRTRIDARTGSPPGRLPLVNSTPAPSSALRMAASVSGSPANRSLSILLMVGRAFQANALAVRSVAVR
jgi:hypothetical protein